MTENKRMALMPFVLGVLSGLLYLSYVISIAFLVPVQFSFSKYGRRSGLVSLACSAAAILAGYLGRLLGIGQLDLTMVLVGAIPPVVLLAALGFVNAGWTRARISTKILSVSLVLSLVAIPLIVMATADAKFISWLQGIVQQALAGTGVDAANASTLANESIVSAKTILQNACGAMILWFVAGSWWIGSSMAARSVARMGDTAAPRYAGPQLSSIKVPAAFLWPTLILWSILFASIVLHTTGIPQAIIWNLALSIASWYAAQGMGIIQFLMKRTRNPALFRLLVPVIVLLTILNSTAGTIVLIALPVLGISEVWLPYRNFKGASV
jgi:hypothetical protein